jgi:hypothetical protein
MNKKWLAVFVVVTGVVVFGTATALTQGGRSGPPELTGSQTIFLEWERDLSPAVAAGTWVAWIEVHASETPPRAELVLLDLSIPSYASEWADVYRRVPVILPDIDENDPLGWLSGGPAADLCTVAVPGSGETSGPCIAFTGRSTGSEALWVYTPALLSLRPGPVVSGPSVSGHVVAWAESTGNETDILTWDLRSGGDPVPAVSGPTAKSFPVISEGAGGQWVAWLDGDPDLPTAELVVRHLASAEEHLVARVAQMAPLSAAGDRLLYTTPDGSGGASLVVFDVERLEGGVIASRTADSCLGCTPEEFLRAAISDDVIVHQDPTFGRPSEIVPLIAHDARAITSYANIAEYLTGYSVSTWFTDAAIPSVSGSRVAWRDAPLSGNEDLIRSVFVARYRLHMPFAGGQP